MISYRKVQYNEAEKIAQTHLKSFPSFFLTSLGYSFLVTFYRTCIVNKDVVALCAVNQNDNQILGFAVGCLVSKQFYKKLIYSNPYQYIYQGLILLCTKPLALIRILNNLEKNINEDVIGNYSELLSFAVLPEMNGLGIGQNLLKEFEGKVKENEIQSIVLTTDLHQNENVISFYKKFGYIKYYDFIAYPKRKMTKLIKKI